MPAPINNPDLRLLSPAQRRIYPNAKTGTGIAPAVIEMGDKHPTLRQRAGRKPGEPDDTTWDALVKLGWTQYRGDAQTDISGFVTVGPDGNALHDPGVRPAPRPTGPGFDL